jgi:defect-in-organelle-trafficking protein DotC
MQKFRVITLLISCIFLLVGCCGKKNEPHPEICAFKEPSTKINAARYAVLRDTAVTTGAQAGLAWRSQAINEMLEKDSRNLDKSFNFISLMLRCNVLPPVLVEGRDTLHIDGTDAIRLSDRVYKIETPPRFVTAPPHWREYLWMAFKSPEKPSPSLLPQNDDERCVWNEYITVGWTEGLQQADSIFSANLGRLKRDYNGMVLYRKLLAQNMVSPPYVAKSELGVTGDENEMRINDQVLRITSTSKLQTNSKCWKAAVTPGFSPCQ